MLARCPAPIRGCQRALTYFVGVVSDSKFLCQSPIIRDSSNTALGGCHAFAFVPWCGSCDISNTLYFSCFSPSFLHSDCMIQRSLPAYLDLASRGMS
jgi:hypothetical protein